MNVPSGVRSVIYIAAQAAFATVLVLSTNQVLTTCAIGLSIGVGILAWRNASAHTASDTPTPTSSSSSSNEGWEADSYMDVVDIAQPQWMLYSNTHVESNVTRDSN